MVWYGMVWYGMVWFGLVWFVQHKYLAGYYSISKFALSLAQLQPQLVMAIIKFKINVKIVINPLFHEGGGSF